MMATLVQFALLNLSFFLKNTTNLENDRFSPKPLLVNCLILVLIDIPLLQT